MVLATDTGSAMLMNGSATHIVDQALRIDKPRTKIDSYAMLALEEAKQDLKIESAVLFKIESADLLKGSIAEQGLIGRVESLSHRINASNLDDISRFLLSTPEIYVWLIKFALDKDKVPKEDLDGLYSSVLRNVRDIPKRHFLSNILAHVLIDLHINIDSTSPQWRSLPTLVVDKGIDIREGQVKPSIQALLDALRQLKSIPYYLDLFTQQRTVLAKTSFTPEIKRGMLEILVKQDFQIDPAKFNAGSYDQLFTFSYYEAQKRSAVKDDPIDQMRLGKQSDWDFSVDTFDTLDEARGVIPANIKAAGALDYVYTIGEMMRVFDVANALVLRWAGGALDIPTGETASNLYRFNKLRNERSTYEERAMLYKRGLNKGDGKMLSNMVANTAFPRLWHKLMLEVTEYIRKAEGKQLGDTYVSKAQIYQSTKNLQYNLTETMTGMAHIQVAEDYAHLQEAMKIIQCPEILGMFGGRRKTIWSVIEQVAKEDLKVMVPTAPLRTIATEGNKIFQWIADFNEGRVQDVVFNNFLSAAEAWIIAQASLDSTHDGLQSSQQPEQPQMPDFLNNMNMPNMNISNLNNMNMPNFDQQDDEFANW